MSHAHADGPCPSPRMVGPFRTRFGESNLNSGSDLDPPPTSNPAGNHNCRWMGKNRCRLTNGPSTPQAGIAHEGSVAQVALKGHPNKARGFQPPPAIAS